MRKKMRIKGIANITGGAFYDKIPRIIPHGMGIEIQKRNWSIPWIFTLIQEKARLADREIFRTLNMGIGMVVVLAKGDIDKARQTLAAHNIKSHVIGEVVKGNRQVCVY
jgi:phosphoribosylformylglycinamidine cyclo-ligase